MSLVLLDTGPLVAMLNRSERYHQRCVDLLTTPQWTLLTCEPVIVEACFILRGVHGAASDILANIRNGLIGVPYRLEDRAAEVGKLVSKFADTPMSLADGCLVDMASQLKTGRILTLDADFRVYRWGRKQPFELLIDVD